MLTYSDLPEHATPGRPAAGCIGMPLHPAGVRLVPYDPRLPPRLAPADPVSQCDCACCAVEGQDVPALSAPVSFYLELTPLCNNHCPGCGNAFVRRGFKSPPLSADQWAQVLQGLRRHAYRLKLTGGEPTLHPQFESIVIHVASHGVPFTLFSNGRWPEPDRLVRLLEGVPTFEGFLLSLHGPDPASHELFTGTAGSFAQTVANMRKASAAGLPSSLSCIITGRNWHRVDEMLGLARTTGASSVVFNRYIGPPIAGLTASAEELHTALCQIGALRAGGHPVKFGNGLPTCFAYAGQAACLAGRAFLTVDPWAQVRPCNHSPLHCGNLLHTSVEEIWASPRLDSWRDWQPARCQACASFPTCRGGCQAQALSLGLEADPLVGPRSPVGSSSLPAELLLYAQAQAVGRYTRRPEAFGSLLMSGNRLFPVGHEIQDALDMLDGRSTLQDIEAVHGPPALALVASLYQEGMVELRVRP